jgi:hypothetical protein
MTTPHQLRQWLADNRHRPEAEARQAELDRLERAAGLMPNIKREGQARVDEPQYSTTRALPLAHSIASVFGRNIPEAVQVFEGYEQTRLRWMKPGPDGKLIPR